MRIDLAFALRSVQKTMPNGQGEATETWNQPPRPVHAGFLLSTPNKQGRVGK
jgi:hypothetical protein